MLLTAGRRATYTTYINLLARCRSVSTQSRYQVPVQSKPSWKHPTRGGQDLSQRYRRLERSLRGKGTYQQDIVDLIEDAASVSSARHARGQSNARTFMGYVIPEEPSPPGSEECCMSGCAICVHDLYSEALEEYKKAVNILRTSLKVLRIPEDQWPEDIQTKRRQPAREKNVALSAFEELERRLKEKRASTVAADVPSPPLQRFIPKKRLIDDVGSMYEGVRWVLFSTR